MFPSFGSEIVEEVPLNMLENVGSWPPVDPGASWPSLTTLYKDINQSKVNFLVRLPAYHVYYDAYLDLFWMSCRNIIIVIFTVVLSTDGV